ncbi:MAG: OsmC family protein [Pseudomonadota bacterium]
MSVEMDVRYDGGFRCTATHGPSGITMTTDAPTDNGGKGEAFSPTDLVAAALGTCVMTIMAMMAERSGLDLTGTRIHLVKDMATAPSRRIGRVGATITFPKGLKISDADRIKLERSVESCPVKQSLHPDIKVATEFIYP